MGIVVWFFRIAIYLTAGAWVLTIVYAQLNCSMFKSFGNQCTGHELLVWMYPVITAPFGGIAFLVLIIMAIFHWGIRN
jgi:SNF family Na+-dependent transporter